MANIHTQIKSGKLMVMHQGEEKEFDMPAWMGALGLLKNAEDGTAIDILQDTDSIIEVLKEHDILLGFLHAGLKECLVGLRAHIRPKEDISISSDKAGDPLTYKPKAQDVPGLSKAKTVTPEQAIATLQATMTKEGLLALIAKME